MSETGGSSVRELVGAWWGRYVECAGAPEGGAVSFAQKSQRELPPATKWFRTLSECRSVFLEGAALSAPRRGGAAATKRRPRRTITEIFAPREDFRK